VAWRDAIASRRHSFVTALLFQNGGIALPVLSLSQDAIARDKPQEKTSDKLQGAEHGTSEPKGQELVYAARISLDRTQMQVENKLVNLSPGMAVTVEIKTGSRRIISYLLSPLLRYKQESLRER
jgi:hemolysin D